MSEKDIEDWNRIAQTYTEFAGPDDPINQQFRPALWESLGDLNGKTVLDLGCGAGWLSQQMVSAGATVIGVDGSIELVKKAQEDFPNIRFIQHDLSGGLPALNTRFDIVIANMVLMDIPELSTLFQSVKTVLKPKGKFIFTMQHPCFFNMKTARDENGVPHRKVTGYLQPEIWRMHSFGGHNHYHRSLTYYFDLLRTNQMAVTRLYEPQHIVMQVEKAGDDLPFYQNVPVFIYIEAMLCP